MRIKAFEGLGRGARRLLRAREGSVATIFAIAMVPVLLAAGVGMDISRAVENRQNLQDALDATGLALAHLPSGTPQATVNQKAQAWLAANLNQNAMSSLNLTVTTSATQIQLNATADVPTTLTQIVGYKLMPIAAASTVNWGVGHVEVALVLDNTGSMADDNKLTNLISSAKTLVTTLLAANTATDPSAVKISIVPFSNTVNIGSTYQGQSWMDPTASAYYGTSTDIFTTNPYNGSPVNRFTLLANTGVAWGGCVETRPQWVGGVDKSYDVLDTAPTSSLPGTQFVPYFAPDEPDTGSYANNYLADITTSTNWKTMQGYTAKYYSYQNCTGSGRNQQCTTVNPTAKTSADPNVSGYNYGPNFGCGVQAIQRLTNSSSTLTTLINKMVAVGDTNVPMGLFWGWMSLSPSAPFSDGVAYGTNQVTKVVIVLTDGANHSSTFSNQNKNGSYYSGVGYAWQHLISTDSKSFSDPGSSMNAREPKICANMKAKGIVIYAVPLEVTDATAKSLLQGCATDTAHYLNVTNSSDLAATFNSIAGSIGQLRLSH